MGILLIYTRRHRYVGDFLFGIAFMFFSLALLSQTGNEMDLGHNKQLIGFFSTFDTGSYATIIVFLLIGTLLTCILQSSAALMAITMMLCSSGVLPIYLGIALVMGENIGTTATANLAALGANTQARRAALAHLVFNVFGVVWVLCVFYPFVNTVCSFVGYDPSSQRLDPARLAVVLAAFHTAFNVCNTAILIWLIPQIEKIVCKMIKPKNKENEDEFRLRYIGGDTIMKTPELSVLEAQKEIQLFAERTQRMFGFVRELLNTDNDAAFNKLFSRIEKYEGISDNMEIEIAKYLDKVSDAHLSDETKAKIRAMLREISEIESIGDSCYNLARTINRKRQTNQDFTEKQYEHIHFMMKLTDDALEQMIVVVEHPEHAGADVNKSFNLENEINNYRNQLKNQNILDVNNKEYDYQMGVYYMDIIAECEKLGDYVVNVVEASSDIKEKKAS